SARHALIAPDGHVKSSVPGITGAATVILINEAMGAHFAQILVAFESGGGAEMSGEGLQTCAYFESGGGTVRIGAEKKKCGAGGFFFAPVGEPWSIMSPKAGTCVTLFQKKFAPLAGTTAPRAIIGDATKVEGQP